MQVINNFLDFVFKNCDDIGVYLYVIKNNKSKEELDHCLVSITQCIEDIKASVDSVRMVALEKCKRIEDLENLSRDLDSDLDELIDDL